MNSEPFSVGLDDVIGVELSASAVFRLPVDQYLFLRKVSLGAPAASKHVSDLQKLLKSDVVRSLFQCDVCDLRYFISHRLTPILSYIIAKSVKMSHTQKGPRLVWGPFEFNSFLSESLF